MAEETDYIKLPLDERCVHKLWKARVHGYEEACKQFRKIDDEKSSEWNKYLGLIKKFVTDSNVVAQEKGLEASLAYIENAHVAGKTAGEVVPLVIAKCIGAPKAKTKDLAIQICLMYVEIEKQEIVVEELLKGTEHKNPKIASACVAALTQGLREFGSKVIVLKPILKRLPSLLEDRDKTVRDESKTLTAEIFRWIGPLVKSQLSGLKPVQLQEVEAEIEKVKNEKAVVQRYLRSQQAKQARLAEEVGGDTEAVGDEPDDDGDDEIDVAELIQPVDILSKLPKDFYDKLEAKKWQERKESLDCLEQLLTNAQNLENGDYGDLIRAVKKVITKDSNVILVGIAAKCMAFLGKGLKKRFQPYASHCLSSLLEKFKEKKQNVVLPLRDAVDAIYDSTTLEAIHEDVIASMDSKNPAVKAETVAFLARCFTKCNSLILNKKLLKAFTVALLKTLNESDPIVRDNSAEAIGTAWKVVGEKVISPYLCDVDPLKIAKVKEASEKAIIVAKAPKAAKKAVEDRPASVAAKGTEKPRAGSAQPRPVKKPVAKNATFVKKSSSTTALNKIGKTSKPLPERELTEDEVIEKASEIFSETLVNGLSDANWKTRLSSVEQLKEIVSTLNSADVQSQLLIKLLSKKPGFKDNNFQVLKIKLECLKDISENFTITTTGASACLNEVIALLGDPKNSSAASEVLLSFADTLKLDFISTEVLEYAFSQQKNPKVQQEALLWLSNAILDFGFIIQPKAVMDNVKKAVAASNPNVRGAVITLLGTMYLYMGPQLGMFFENEKPALLQQINAEFDKHAGEKPPSPKRGKLKGQSNGIEEGEPEETNQIPNIQDLVPRVDISSKITQTLVSELVDRDWKVRTEAINKIQEMITEARFITNNLGEATPGIAERLTDSNARLAATTVSLCESIAIAMGSQCRNYVRNFFPGLLQGLSDNKTYLRAASIKCINTWGDTCGYREFFEGEMIASALKTGSPTLRSELWTWLAEKLPDVKNVSKDELLACLPYLYANLEDRNSDVRKNANEAVFGFMLHIGYGPMFQACDKLRPSSGHAIKQILDKTRGNLPDIPEPPSKSAKQSSNKAAAAQNSSAKSRASSAPKGKVVAPARKKKEEDVDTAPLLKVNNLKMQRTIDENKLKVLKWNFVSPREEFIEQLKDQMITAGVNKTLITNMFHADFKFHLKAIDALSEDVNINTDAMVSNLDLILKWMTIRFFDTNPSVLLRGLEYLLLVFRLLGEEKYSMQECEASSFLPYLIIKAGDPKDTVRNTVKEIFDAIGLVYPVSKLFTHIMEGIKSKNARQRTGCLEQLSRLIENYGLQVCQPSPPAALKEIAKQISDRDNSVRNAALNCVIAAYYIAGDRVRQMIGTISDKDLSLLDERIKRAAKLRPPSIPVATVKPTPVAPMRRAQPTPQPEPDEYDSANEADDPCTDDERADSPPPPSLPAPIVQQQRLCNNEPEHSLSSVDVFSSPEMCDILPDIILDAEIDERGPFGLDRGIIEAIEAVEIRHPKPELVEYDLQYFQETVIPFNHNRAAASPAYVINTQTITRHSSSPQKPSNLESWIAIVGSATSAEEIIRAMEEIESVLVSDDKRKDLNGLELQLIQQTVSRLSILINSQDDHTLKCYKLVFSILMKIYSFPEYSRKIGDIQTQQLLSQLISLLVEKKLERLDNSNVFQKAVNSLVLRVLERSDHTVVICVLLKILYDSVDQDTFSRSYQELAMKCIWKTLKFIPEWDAELDYNRILAEVHRFLTDFSSSWWKRQPNDTPLRTYKTLVHTIVQTKGMNILTAVNVIPGVGEDSEIYLYINKLLKHLKLDEKSDEISDKKQNVSRNVHEELTNILKKIGNKEETQQGLRMLYDFRKCHPEVNISPFISKSSKFFQQYVIRGLQSIDSEKNEDIMNKADKYIENVKVRNNVDHAEAEKDEESDAQRYQQKLRQLQMRAGWEQKRHAPVAEPAANLIPALRVTSPPQRLYRDREEDGTASLAQLRDKLTQLKAENI